MNDLQRHACFAAAIQVGIGYRRAALPVGLDPRIARFRRLRRPCRPAEVLMPLLSYRDKAQGRIRRAIPPAQLHLERDLLGSRREESVQCPFGVGVESDDVSTGIDSS